MSTKNVKTQKSQAQQQLQQTKKRVGSVPTTAKDNAILNGLPKAKKLAGLNNPKIVTGGKNLPKKVDKVLVPLERTLAKDERKVEGAVVNDKPLSRNARRARAKRARRETESGSRPLVSDARGVHSRSIPRLTRLGEHGVRITHKELVTPITASNQFACTTWYISISNQELFPTGFEQSINFQYQKLEKFSVRFVTSQGTQNNGQIFVAINPDSTAQPPKSLTEMNTLPTCYGSPIWKDFEVNNPKTNMEKETAVLIPDPRDPPSDSLDMLYNFGLLHVATQGISPNADGEFPIIGELFIEYTMVVSEPRDDIDQEYVGEMCMFNAAPGPDRVNPFGLARVPQIYDPTFYDFHFVSFDGNGGVFIDDANRQTAGILFKSAKDLSVLITMLATGNTFDLSTLFWFNANAMGPGTYTICIENTGDPPTDKMQITATLNINKFDPSFGIQSGNTLELPEKWYGYNMIGFNIGATSCTSCGFLFQPSRIQWPGDGIFEVPQTPAATSMFGLPVDDRSLALMKALGAKDKAIAAIFSHLRPKPEKWPTRMVGNSICKEPLFYKNYFIQLSKPRSNNSVKTEPVEGKPYKPAEGKPPVNKPLNSKSKVPTFQDSPVLERRRRRSALADEHGLTGRAVPFGYEKGDGVIQFMYNHNDIITAEHLVSCPDCLIAAKARSEYLVKSEGREERSIADDLIEMVQTAEKILSLVPL